MSYQPTQIDHDRLVGCHPSQIKIVHRAWTLMDDTNDFVVARGCVRTLEQQRENIRTGASRTMRSRHIPQMNKCGMSCAVDLWALTDLNHDGHITGNEIDWLMKWYKPVADLIKKCTILEGFPADYTQWGFDLWNFDGPHFQINPHYEPWA